jgi:energy-coupling factor transporter ATP-binding protein EcfA2
VKIKSLQISGFRGIRKYIGIDFDSSKSILIYGDNGSGKSSITDAFEWFYYDRVEHLTSKEIGADAKGTNALRNTFLSNSEDAYVEFKYSDSECNSQKKLFLKKSKLTSEYTNTSQKFKDYINTTLKENLLLRYKDLLRFILSTKTQKLEEISQIIGLSEVSKVKSVLKKAVNDLKRELKQNRFDDRISSQQRNIFERIQQDIWNDEQYFDAIKILVAPLKLPIEVKDVSSIDDILEAMKKPEDKEAIANQLSYEKVIEHLRNLKISFDTICASYKAVYDKCQRIAKDKDKFKKINLEPLLSQGLSILEKKLYEDDRCPLCLQDKDREELIDELRKRIEELSIFKKERDAATEDINTTLRLIQGPLEEAENALKEKCLLLEDNSASKKEIEKIRGNMSAAKEKIKKVTFAELETISKPDDFLNFDINALSALISLLISKKDKIVTGKKDDLIFTVHSKIESVKQSYKEIKSLKKSEEILAQQQLSLELVYNDFVKRQRNGLSSLLTVISKDMNDLYQFMNESENISEIELIPLDEEDEFVGVTLQFKFHGRLEAPPHKYLSESHLNCLGICLFLASVKAYNKLNRFIVLDDVISSFDTNHRARFARLLVEKFSDYQIILFTHEKNWFEIISNMVRGKNWIIKRMYWDHENGATIEPPPSTLKEEIENQLKKADTTGLGNSIRIYLEHLLKEICHNLKAKVEFRFNGHNENRMAHELLSELKSKLKDRKCELKDQVVFDRLASSMFLVNRASHDSSFSEDINDLKMFYSDIQDFERLVRCSQCGSLVSKKNYNEVSGMVSCSCGKLKYTWKK